MSRGRSKTSSSDALGNGEVGVRLLRLLRSAVLQRLQQGEEAGAARRHRRRHHYYLPPLDLQKEKKKKKKRHTEKRKELRKETEAMLENRERAGRG